MNYMPLIKCLCVCGGWGIEYLVIMRQVKIIFHSLLFFHSLILPLATITKFIFLQQRLLLMTLIHNLRSSTWPKMVYIKNVSAIHTRFNATMWQAKINTAFITPCTHEYETRLIVFKRILNVEIYIIPQSIKYIYLRAKNSISHIKI